MKTALLIPAYQPKDNFSSFLSLFKGDEFDYFLVIDDGSGEKYRDIFVDAMGETCFKIISYPQNKGKGFAIKTGIEYLRGLENGPDIIITCDCDGQHLYEDVLRLRDEAKENGDSLILGVRGLNSSDIPWKSKVGNRISSSYVAMVTGLEMDDVQTGLRAIPKKMFDLALNVKGSRYEYELNFLLEAIKVGGLRCITIQTIYENNNVDSHFRPFRDTIRIYHASLVRLLIGALSLGVDFGFFALFSSFLPSSMKEGIGQLLWPSLFGGLLSLIGFVVAIYWLGIPNKLDRKKQALRHGALYLGLLALACVLSYILSLAISELLLAKFLGYLAVILLYVLGFLLLSYARRKRMSDS